METIILTDEHFDEKGKFKDQSFYNEITGKYEFKGNVEIKSKFKYAIFLFAIISDGNIWAKNGIRAENGDIRAENGNIWAENGDIKMKIYQLLNIKPFLRIGNIGSRKDYTIFYFTKEHGIIVKTGCFFDTIEKFSHQIELRHGLDNQYAIEYNMTIEYVEKMYKYYLLKSEDK
jgi:hypothetical protein